jgi:hypothetical protein
MKKARMTPKEKAIDLIDSFLFTCSFNLKNAKISALTCAKEIKSYDWFIPSQLDLDNWNGYWDDVIKEIENYNTYNP